MLACLLNYDLAVLLLMRYLGRNYVGAHRDLVSTAAPLHKHSVPEDFICYYKKVTTVGCPRIFNATITREKAFKTGK